MPGPRNDVLEVRFDAMDRGSREEVGALDAGVGSVGMVGMVGFCAIIRGLAVLFSILLMIYIQNGTSTVVQEYHLFIPCSLM